MCHSCGWGGRTFSKHWLGELFDHDQLQSTHSNTNSTVSYILIYFTLNNISNILSKGWAVYSWVAHLWRLPYTATHMIMYWWRCGAWERGDINGWMTDKDGMISKERLLLLMCYCISLEMIHHIHWNGWQLQLTHLPDKKTCNFF